MMGESREHKEALRAWGDMEGGTAALGRQDLKIQVGSALRSRNELE
jgi:hypothetical protein